jgi:SUF system FeS cluster assembly, SufBD
MQITPLTTSSLTLTADTVLLDLWEVECVEIIASPGISLSYVFLGERDGHYERRFILSEGVTFLGGAVIYGKDITYSATTDIRGDHVDAHLQILGLATDDAHLDIRGSSQVLSPYRQVRTRVDQNNIYIWHGGVVRGVPVLEIATDDIEWGHSCRMHRIAGEALFYLQSHGLDTTTAEWLLIDGELRRHTSVISDCDVCDGLLEQVRSVVFWT